MILPGGKLRSAEDGRLSFWCPGCDGPHQVAVGDGDGPQHRVESVCHSFVTDGRIQYLGDCTHALAGQTVDLPNWEGA